MQRDYVSPGLAAVHDRHLACRSRSLYWQHAKGDIAQAQHFERELAATYRDTRAQVTQDVRIGVRQREHRDASRSLFIRDELVPPAREAYRVASTSYSLGGSSALEVLTARSALLAAAEPTRRRTRRREHGARRSRTRPRRARSRHWSQQ